MAGQKRITGARMLVAAGALMVLQVTAALASSDPLYQAFRNPPKAARPIMRWWWPGDAVTDKELRRELALLDATGIGGVEIQSFNPGIPGLTPAEREAVDNYAEPSFFAHVKTAAAEAAARGMALDYTFGSAWPSGGGFAIAPEKALIELTMASTAVEGGKAGPVKVAIPARTKRLGALSSFDPRVKDPAAAGWRARFDAQGKIVAVMAMRGSAPALKEAGPTMGLQLSAWSDVTRPGTLDPSSRIDLTGKLSPDGTLDWTPPPGQWQVFVFKQYASNMGVTGSAGKGPQLVLDHFDHAAFDAHAARVGDPMVAALGPARKGMRATFVDSLELMQDLPWSRDFLSQFKARRGYDLLPWLPFLVQPGWMQAWGERYSPPYFDAADKGGLAERVRADYRLTVSDLLFENFIGPWIAWNRANGMKAKFQAHGGAIDIIKGYGLADIPETEDLVHGGDPLFTRLARSAANIYGRPFVSAESMVWKDRAFSVTPDEWRKRADLLFAGGVNAQTLHGYSYALHTDTWPGWYAFQPSPFAGGFSSMMDERNPVWVAMPRLVKYMTRMNAVLRAGESVVPVAMFYGDIGYYVGIEDEGAGKQAREKALIAGGYDFDRINPDGILQSKIEGRALLTPGGHRYAVLVLPKVAAMRAETAEKIATFAEAGLPVLFTETAPDRDLGLLDREHRDARVRAAVAKVKAAGGRIVKDSGLVDGLRSAGAPANLRFTGDASDLVFVQRKVGRRLVYFLYNRGSAERDASFLAPMTGGAQRWDAMAGTTGPQDSTAVEGGTRISMKLAPQASALIVVDPNLKPGKVAPAPTIAEQALPASGWRLRVAGHIAGGAGFRHDLGETALRDWSEIEPLSAFSGLGTYETTVRIPKEWMARGVRVMIDLGQVHDMATLIVNGRKLPPLVSAPWTADISEALRPGVNRLEIAVANVPQNAMISKAPGFKDLKPVPAGLTGPVVLKAVRRP
jgi:hypothetical protein